MAGNARFHNKFHRRNHHSIPTTGYPDSGTDPIASQDEPFQGDFYLNGSLSANGSGTIDGNLLVKGNLSALGEFSYIDTVVSVTSALSVVNTGTGPALTVWQYGDQPIARFIDRNDSCTLLLEDDGRISINTCNLEPGIGITVNHNLSSNQPLTANAQVGGYHYLVGSVAEGHGFAVGLDSHAEGVSSRSLGQFSHAEGLSALTLTQATASHAEGEQTITLGRASHAEGRNTKANGAAAHAEGLLTLAEGDASHAEGYLSHSRGTYAHSEGALTSAWGNFGSHAEGFNTRASGDHSHAEGVSTVAASSGTHAEGFATSASSLFSHSEGAETLASGAYSHAEGDETIASGVASHAEGFRTTASQTGAHAEGNETKALNIGSHAQGASTVASGQNSHAEGAFNTARGNTSHVQGIYNAASGTNSFVSGKNSIAVGENNTVIGEQCYSRSYDSMALGFLANAVHTQSLVYSNYCNYYSSSSFADHTFNVFASGGNFLFNPTTVGDPISTIKFIVTDEGLVGVNTPSPVEQLTVNGNTLIAGTLSCNGQFSYNYFANNVGIKTRAASEELTVNGSISANRALITHTATARSLNIIHSPANDASSPYIRLGEFDTTAGNAGFSGLLIRYQENSNLTEFVTFRTPTTATVNNLGGAVSAMQINLDGCIGINSLPSRSINDRLQIVGNTILSGGYLSAISPNFTPLFVNRGLSGVSTDPIYNSINGTVGLNTIPVSSYALHVRGGNIRVDGVDYSTFPGFNGTLFDCDGQSLFDLRSGGLGANYSLSIAESGLGYFMKFFGGRTGDTNPFIAVRNNTPIRFAQFNSFYGTGFAESARIGSTGNLVIGIANDGTERLTVAGNISARGELIIDGNTTLGKGSTSIVTISSGPINLANATAAADALVFGTGVSIANLYRSANDTLKTDDNFVVGTLGAGATNTIITHNAGTLETRTVDARVWGSTLVDNGSVSLLANRVIKASDGDSVAVSSIADNGVVVSTTSQISATGGLSAAFIDMHAANVITPSSVTDSGQFLILTVNGNKKAIRLWDYTV